MCDSHLLQGHSGHTPLHAALHIAYKQIQNPSSPQIAMCDFLIDFCNVLVSQTIPPIGDVYAHNICSSVYGGNKSHTWRLDVCEGQG